MHTLSKTPRMQQQSGRRGDVPAPVGLLVLSAAAHAQTLRCSTKSVSFFFEPAGKENLLLQTLCQRAAEVSAYLEDAYYTSLCDQLLDSGIGCNDWTIDIIAPFGAPCNDGICWVFLLIEPIDRFEL